MAEFGDEGNFVPAHTAEEFVASLERPRRLVIMVNAGPATDAVIDEFAPLLEPGDMIIDGGNAHFKDTRRREAALRESAACTSSAWASPAARRALSTARRSCPAARPSPTQSLGPMLEAIAAHVDGVPCCTHVGPDGAGHFVKMVHNGIEYADMQLIAEAYDLLRHAGGFEPAQIAEIFQHLEQRPPRLLPDRDHRRGPRAHRRQDGRALRRHRARPGRAEGHRPLDRAERPRPGRAGRRHRRGDLRPVAVRPRRPARRRPRAARTRPRGGRRTRGAFADKVEQALYASKIVSYAQGWNMIARGQRASTTGTSTSGRWRSSGAAAASSGPRSSTGSGPPTRATPQLPTLLADPDFGKEVTAAQDAWRDVVATAVHIGIPVPGFSAALAYYDALRAERLPAALIQGLRDFFGAHTYRRTDAEGSFHTLWAEDRSEVGR